MKKVMIGLPCLMLFLVFPRAAYADDACDPIHIIQTFFNGFNEKDLEKIDGLVDYAVMYMNIREEKTSVDADGDGELAQMFREFYAEGYEAESRLGEKIISNPPFYAVQDIMEFNAGDTRAEISSVSVFRIDDCEITHVWYFPSTKPRQVLLD